MAQPKSRLNEKEFKSQLAALMASFSAQYQIAAQTCADRILEYLDNGYSTVDAVNKSLKDTDFLNDVKDIIKHSLLSAAAYGYGILPSQVAKPATIKSTLLHEAWTHDKMPLSKRLHGTSIKMRQAIVDTVSKGMRELKTFKEIAVDLAKGYNRPTVINPAELPKYLSDLEKIARRVAKGDKDMLKPLQKAIMRARTQVAKMSQNGAPTVSLKTAYNALVDACEKFQLDAIDRTVNLAVNERARYYGERIARTEMSRAYSDGVFSKTFGDSEVIGYRWRLSSNHPRFDICDLHANADFYGMGAGVYPKDAYPLYPAHPHCRCSPVPVYTGMLDDEDTPFGSGDEPEPYNDKPVRKWIDNLSDENKKNLLGVGGAMEYAKTRNINLVKQWQGHEAPKPRLTQDMFEKNT